MTTSSPPSSAIVNGLQDIMEDSKEFNDLEQHDDDVSVAGSENDDDDNDESNGNAPLTLEAQEHL